VETVAAAVADMETEAAVAEKANSRNRFPVLAGDARKTAICKRIR
jgi:hypothetical protein